MTTQSIKSYSQTIETINNLVLQQAIDLSEYIKRKTAFLRSVEYDTNLHIVLSNKFVY